MNIHQQLMMSMETQKTIIQRRKKLLILFGDMITHKELSPIFTELFIQGRKFNIHMFL